MSNIVIGLYGLELDVEYTLFPEEGDNWESQYFAGDVEVTDVIICGTDISLMMLLTDEQFTEIEDEVIRCLREDAKDDYNEPYND